MKQMITRKLRVGKECSTTVPYNTADTLCLCYYCEYLLHNGKFCGLEKSILMVCYTLTKTTN